MAVCRRLPISAVRQLPKNALDPLFERRFHTKAELVEEIHRTVLSGGELVVRRPGECLDRLGGKPYGGPVVLVADPADSFSGCPQDDDSDASSDISTARSFGPYDTESLLDGTVGAIGRPAVVYRQTKNMSWNSIPQKEPVHRRGRKVQRVGTECSPRSA